jgi:group I intron endonuclease
MEKEFHFVYITKNLINEKCYVGDHSTDNLNDGYLGSGILLGKAIKKYGIKNFSTTILEHCDSKETAFLTQEKYIIEFNTLQPNGYNISPKGGHNVKNCWSDDSKLKSSESHKGEKNGMHGTHLSEEAKKNLSEQQKGKKQKPFTDEQKQKLKLAWEKRRLTPMSDETKLKISLASKGKPKNNTYWVGKHHSVETIEKIRKNLKGKEFSDERKQNISNALKKKGASK